MSSRFYLLAGLIVCFAFTLRFFQVADHPHDLYVDEVAIGYNAYSILTTGKDEHGAFLPITFASFGDYKLPGYIYLTALFEYFLGPTALAVRLPSVLFGTASIASFMTLIFLSTKNEKLTTLAGLLLAISPWHIQFSRAGFEANIALFFLLSGVTALVAAATAHRHQLLSFWGGLLCLLLSLYSYHTERVFTPLICIVIFLLYRPLRAYIRRQWTFLIPLIFLLVATFPFVSYVFSAEGSARATSQFFTGDLRRNTNDWFTNSAFLYAEQYVRNYLSSFSLNYLFFSGDQNGHHSVREIGMNYLWELPFFLLGFWKTAYKGRPSHSPWERLLFIWLLISPLAASLAQPNPHALRSLPLVLPITYFVAYGLFICIPYAQRFAHIPRGAWQILLCILIMYSMLSYLHIYYVHYSKRTDPDWAGGYREAIEYVAPQATHYNKVVITKEMLQAYIFLAWYGKIPPVTVQSEPNRRRQLGLYYVVTDPYIPSPGEKVLYIAPHWVKKWPGQEQTVITNRGNDTVFHIWGN